LEQCDLRIPNLITPTGFIEKKAELDPKIDALIAKLKEQQKNKKGV
jgi:hypothetical protein